MRSLAVIAAALVATDVVLGVTIYDAVQGDWRGLSGLALIVGALWVAAGWKDRCGPHSAPQTVAGLEAAWARRAPLPPDEAVVRSAEEIVRRAYARGNVRVFDWEEEIEWE